MVIVNASAHFELEQIIKSDIKQGSVERSIDLARMKLADLMLAALAFSWSKGIP
jgi:hypothetical protein